MNKLKIIKDWKTHNFDDEFHQHNNKIWMKPVLCVVSKYHHPPTTQMVNCITGGLVNHELILLGRMDIHEIMWLVDDTSIVILMDMMLPNAVNNNVSMVAELASKVKRLYIIDDIMF